MIVSFQGRSAAELQQMITTYHNELKIVHSSDLVICSCSMVNVNGLIEALVVFNSKRLGNV